MKRLLIISAIIATAITGCYRDPVANFAYTPANPVAGDQVIFDNLSVDAEAFEWSFGDGTYSTAFSPVHAFPAGGKYTVQLTAFGHGGETDVTFAQITVISIDPTAEFSTYTYLPGESGLLAVETDMVFVGEQVEFYNTSKDAVAYSWSFGDGYTTDLASPVYSYDTPGTYTIILSAYGSGDELDQFTRKLKVVEGINSVLRITVLEFNDEYPVEGASVILYGTPDDWYDENNPSPEAFTTALGKCVFQGLNYQNYYVDVLEENHDNYTLAADDFYRWIETQALEPGFIHDFIAYVDYYPGNKKAQMTRLSRKLMAKEEVMSRESVIQRLDKQNKFSKER